MMERLAAALIAIGVICEVLIRALSAIDRRRRK